MSAIITGGAGFIGSNAASRFLKRGVHVVILDNLCRAGARQNLNWLQLQGPLTFYDVDLRRVSSVRAVFRAHRDASIVLHLAAQVAVTKSVENPREDFAVNALGTLNVLEAIRCAGIDAPVIYSSTNKVYGTLANTRFAERDGRYALVDRPFGIGEDQPLEFHSPYGCSKGAADQYVHDYHQIYGLKTVVFRQSCIYGPRQFGLADQGWIAWLMIAATCGRPITIYGDGKQVRDILYVDDLLDAFDAAAARIDSVAGCAFNIGGGPENVLAILELIQFLAARSKQEVLFGRADWRPGDQRAYVSDIRLAERVLDWKPRISKAQGLELLYEWVCRNRCEFS